MAAASGMGAESKMSFWNGSWTVQIPMAGKFEVQGVTTVENCKFELEGLSYMLDLETCPVQFALPDGSLQFVVFASRDKVMWRLERDPFQIQWDRCDRTATAAEYDVAYGWEKVTNQIHTYYKNCVTGEVYQELSRLKDLERGRVWCHQHPLGPVDASSQWFCDGCAKRRTDARYHCKEGCDYDLCSVCAPRLVFGGPPARYLPGAGPFPLGVGGPMVVEAMGPQPQYVPYAAVPQAGVVPLPPGVGGPMIVEGMGPRPQYGPLGGVGGPMIVEGVGPQPQYDPPGGLGGPMMVEGMGPWPLPPGVSPFPPGVGGPMVVEDMCQQQPPTDYRSPLTHPHPVESADELPHWMCDGCGEEYGRYDERCHCTQGCDYDLCKTCMPRLLPPGAVPQAPPEVAPPPAPPAPGEIRDGMIFMPAGIPGMPDILKEYFLGEPATGHDGRQLAVTKCGAQMTSWKGMVKPMEWGIKNHQFKDFYNQLQQDSNWSEDMSIGAVVSTIIRKKYKDGRSVALCYNDQSPSDMTRSCVRHDWDDNAKLFFEQVIELQLDEPIFIFFLSVYQGTEEEVDLQLSQPGVATGGAFEQVLRQVNRMRHLDCRADSGSIVKDLEQGLPAGVTKTLIVLKQMSSTQVQGQKFSDDDLQATILEISDYAEWAFEAGFVQAASLFREAVAAMLRVNAPESKQCLDIFENAANLEPDYHQAQTINLTCRRLTGGSFASLAVAPKWTGVQVRRALQRFAQEGSFVASLLTTTAEVLERDRTVADAGLKDGDEVTVVLGEVSLVGAVLSLYRAAVGSLLAPRGKLVLER